MGLFTPKWLRFHHRICDRYEQIAFPLVIESDKDLANPTMIAGRILAEELALQPAEGAHLALQLYGEFQKLEIAAIMKKELASKPGPIPADSDIEELLGIMRRRFHIQSHWHVYFLNFVISYLFEKKDLGIERGDYLMRIALGTVPDEKGITKLLKRTLRFARFIEHDERKKG